jgi:DNA-binding NtrC family response regulator
MRHDTVSRPGDATPAGPLKKSDGACHFLRHDIQLSIQVASIERSSDGSTQQPAPRILLVEDDAPLRHAMERSFFQEGHDVVACATFETAKRQLLEEVFDVLLTDVRLGAFNGLQLAVLARDLYPGIRIIVFSGFDDNVLRHEAERIGATYLVKPVVIATLLELMR